MQQESGSELVRSEFARQFRGQSGEWPRLYRAPGRINIIGEHTDYNGGLVFPSTIDLHTWVASKPRSDRSLNVYNSGSKELHSLDLDRLECGTKGQPAEYLKGVAWALQEDGQDLRGCDVAVSGNIPLGGGLSSSASLELALSYALLDSSGIKLERGRLALLCQRAESEFVGAQCGIMDQYAIAFGVKGKAMMLDCSSLDFDLVEIPPKVNFLVIHSGVSHRVSTGKYNSRRDECEDALNRLRVAIPGLGNLCQLTIGQLEAGRGLLTDVLYRRCRHVVTENQRVGEAFEALKSSDLERLGSLINLSHASLRSDYEVSCRELDDLVAVATGCDGVLGSRMMGAGFGGCTISIVESGAAEQAARHIRNEYARLSGQEPWMHIAAPADAVKRIG
jgi:galactokinase